MARLALLMAIASVVAAVYDPSPAAFDRWAAEHHRSYDTTDARRAAYSHYVANARKADELQRRNPHATFGATQFADRDLSRPGHPAQSPATVAAALQRLRLPSASFSNSSAGRVGVVDWRMRGAVTPVENAGLCQNALSGFGVVGNIEGAHFVKTKRLVPASVSQVVGCAAGSCNAFMPIDRVLAWLSNYTHGTSVLTAAAEKFRPDQPWPQCRSPRSRGEIAAVVRRVVSLPPNEALMAVAVTRGPIAVAVDAQSWQLYQGGVWTACPGDNLNDVATIVGFDDVANPPYWVLKSAWGTQWGEDGYIRIAKGSNQCGVATFPWTVDVKRW